MVETAFDNKKELNKVVNKLLENKLVASCYTIESNSSWNWNNNRENCKEYLLQMKTKKTKLIDIFEIILGSAADSQPARRLPSGIRHRNLPDAT